MICWNNVLELSVFTVGATSARAPSVSLRSPTPDFAGKASHDVLSRLWLPANTVRLLFPHRWGRSGIGGGAAIQFKAQGPVPSDANRPPASAAGGTANLFPQISILLLKTPS